jgi:hypothetical protein
MFTKYLALVNESTKIPNSEVAKISAAIQKQLTRDFEPIWDIRATIDFYENLEDVPADYWPIIIRDDIGFAGADGVHLDGSGQPYALVQASDNISLTCAHECLEMVVDPFGDRLVASQSLKPGQGRVNYLVEVCDPSEAEDFAYSVNGILVSDFYTPNFFDPVINEATKYSYSGAIKAPLQILPGGYISWMVPETKEWWQATFFGARPAFRSLGFLKKTEGKGWREIIDAATFEPVEKNLSLREVSPMQMKSVMVKTTVDKAGAGRSIKLREDIENVIALARPGSLTVTGGLTGRAGYTAGAPASSKEKLQLALEQLPEDRSIPFLVKLSVLLSASDPGDPDQLNEDADLSDFMVRQEHWVMLRAFLLKVIQQNNS